MVKHSSGNGVTIYFPGDEDNINECLEYINNNQIRVIFIIASERQGFYSIDFLNFVKEPEKIKDIHVEGNITNYDSIYRFKKLTEMSIYLKNDEKIDLARFPELIDFSSDNLSSFINLDIPPITYGLFTGKVDFDKLNMMKNMKKISFGEVKQISFTQLSGLTNLECVAFTQCGIRDLNGIEQFKNIKAIKLYYCRSLACIEGISKLPQFTHLWLCACPKLINISEIGEIEKLIMLSLETMKKAYIDFVYNMKSKETIECLDLENCADLHSLKFLDNYPNLKMFGFWNTNVLDGDLTPCLRLKLAHTANKRHYNLKSNQLPFDNVHYSTSHWWIY